VGYKSTHDWGRLNAALFYNEISDMQREINLPSQGAGVIQLVRNSADATIFGAEVDGTFRVTDNLLVLASVGYIDASYDEVFVDLNQDGIIGGADEDLDIPRAPELTWSIGATYDIPLGSWAVATARINYAYRDEMAWTDDNRGFVLDQEILDAGFDIYTNDGHWVFSLYGRNMLDEVKHGGDTQLPPDIGGVPTGGTFSPLAKGQVYGGEVTYNF
jgi:iron complex outermembrane receptor protein